MCISFKYFWVSFWLGKYQLRSIYWEVYLESPFIVLKYWFQSIFNNGSSSNYELESPYFVPNPSRVRWWKSVNAGAAAAASSKHNFYVSLRCRIQTTANGNWANTQKCQTRDNVLHENLIKTLRILFNTHSENKLYIHDQKRSLMLYAEIWHASLDLLDLSWQALWFYSNF